MKQIEIFDTTLRDGAQSAEISFSFNDKLNVLALLDDLGIAYAECGNPSASPIDKRLFRFLKENPKRYKNLKIVAFTATCREGLSPEQDIRLNETIELSLDYVGIVGKASVDQAENILKISKEENLRLIASSIEYVKSFGKSVIFYAEHFFDGCVQDMEYSFSVIHKAFEAGAETVVLCDTNGGSMMTLIRKATERAVKEGLRIGIHCHNDCGLAVANTIEAVNAGAVQVHGTFCGIGERCGNTDLCVLIPDLQLKMKLSAVPEDKLLLLASTARAISDFANIQFNERTPYVGKFAFAHKAGMHIDGYLKSHKSFEHVEPDKIGNRRSLLLSELSGRAAVADKLALLDPNIKKDSAIVETVLNRIKDAQAEGYQFDNSDGSLVLLMLEVLEKRKSFFELVDFKIVLSDPTKTSAPTAAVMKIKVGDTTALVVEEGNGPVNAMDKVLRKALTRFYPSLKEVKLIDYRVRVIDSADATAAKVRVLIDSSDGKNSWRTIGVSGDIIEASWEALCESFEYKLLQLDKLI